MFENLIELFEEFEVPVESTKPKEYTVNQVI